jgi:formylglycine-generating enzyme required for sulfatase activity
MILVLLLFVGNLNLMTQDDLKEKFLQALAFYNQGDYENATSYLETIETLLGKEEFIFKAKVYILFCACYEKMGKRNMAKSFSAKIGQMLESGQIDELPAIKGMEMDDIQSIKRDIMQSVPLLDEEKEPDEYHFKFKEPEPVQPVDQKAVIHYEARKEKKKKFPWIVVAIGVVIVGVVVYFLLNKNKEDEMDIDIPEIDWIYIPAGEFQMGDNFNEGDSDEKPVHPVYLTNYSISKYEISVSQYDAYCLDTGRQTLSNEFYLQSWQKDQPAFYISWMEANAFCQWMSQKTGENIHLPTEAQWERAARGTIQNRYPWGNSSPDCSFVNFAGCNRGIQFVFNFPAGATATGIYQMAGNVWEWCQDYYDPLYYSQSPYQNPQGASSNQYRVLRGGSILSPAGELRSANRFYMNPGQDNLDTGFRIVKEN